MYHQIRALIGPAGLVRGLASVEAAMAGLERGKRQSGAIGIQVLDDDAMILDHRLARLHAIPILQEQLVGAKVGN